MKNYQYAILCALLLATQSAQASHIKTHTAPSAGNALIDAAQPAVRLGGAYKFVDTDVPARSPGVSAVLPSAAGLPKPSAQSFAGGAGSTSNTAAARAGLANIQASAERIAEPATELLLLVALSALAIAVRRQSPT